MFSTVGGSREALCGTYFGRRGTGTPEKRSTPPGPRPGGPQGGKEGQGGGGGFRPRRGVPAAGEGVVLPPSPKPLRQGAGERTRRIHRPLLHRLGTHAREKLPHTGQPVLQGAVGGAPLDDPAREDPGEHVDRIPEAGGIRTHRLGGPLGELPFAVSGCQPLLEELFRLHRGRDSGLLLDGPIDSLPGNPVAVHLLVGLLRHEPAIQVRSPLLPSQDLLGRPPPRGNLRGSKGDLVAATPHGTNALGMRPHDGHPRFVQVLLQPGRHGGTCRTGSHQPGNLCQPHQQWNRHRSTSCLQKKPPSFEGGQGGPAVSRADP